MSENERGKKEGRREGERRKESGCRKTGVEVEVEVGRGCRDGVLRVR